MVEKTTSSMSSGSELLRGILRDSRTAKYALRMQWLTVVGLVYFLRWSRAPLIKGVSGRLMRILGKLGREESEDISGC